MESGSQQPCPATRSKVGLDWLNFFVADVQTGFGPFVSLYLAASGWKQGTIGTLLTINSIVAIVVQGPVGGLIDWTRRKRLIVGIGLAFTAAGGLLIPLSPTLAPVTVGEIMQGLAGGTLRTAMTAISLGLVGHRAFHTRIGRNQLFNSLGTALTAGGMGVLGTLVSLRAPFYASAALCLGAFAALLQIRGKDISYERARSSEGRKEKGTAEWKQLVRNHRLLVFAACLFLFQFANASMLPLATERMGSARQHMSELITAALVIVPQLVTAAVAGFVARKADVWGRKWLLVAGFAVLPLQAGLFALTASPWWLVSVQLLGGLTAAVVGILAPLVVADVTRRSGRYNAALGATTTVGAVGAAVSTSSTGFMVQGFGFLIGFLLLAAIGLLGLGLLAWKLPETSHEARRED